MCWEWGIEEVGLDILSVTCPETSGGAEIRRQVYMTLDPSRDRLWRQELGSCLPSAYTLLSVSS